MKTLYEITGKINDINTLLVNKREYDSLVDASRQALEALEFLRDGLCGPKHVPNAITALREALEVAPEPAAVVQKPLAYIHTPAHLLDGKVRPVVSFEKYEGDYEAGIYSVRIPLYAAASQPTSQPLADGELDLILQKSPIKANYADLTALVRAVEKAHGIGGEV